MIGRLDCEIDLIRPITKGHPLRHIHDSTGWTARWTITGLVKVRYNKDPEGSPGKASYAGEQNKSRKTSLQESSLPGLCTGYGVQYGVHKRRCELVSNASNQPYSWSLLIRGNNIGKAVFDADSSEAMQSRWRLHQWGAPRTRQEGYTQQQRAGSRKATIEQ